MKFLPGDVVQLPEHAAEFLTGRNDSVQALVLAQRPAELEGQDLLLLFSDGTTLEMLACGEPGCSNHSFTKVYHYTLIQRGTNPP